MSELFDRMRSFIGDEQKLFRRIAGRTDLWEECVHLFPGKEIISEMDEALQTGNDTVLYKNVHRLKGNLANFGFDSAAEKADAVIQAMRRNDSSEMKCRYTELREEYIQIIERIGGV